MSENPRALELLLQVVQIIWKENCTESIPALSSVCNDENLSHTTKSKFKFEKQSSLWKIIFVGALQIPKVPIGGNCHLQKWGRNTAIMCCVLTIPGWEKFPLGSQGRFQHFSGCNRLQNYYNPAGGRCSSLHHGPLSRGCFCNSAPILGNRIKFSSVMGVGMISILQTLSAVALCHYACKALRSVQQAPILHHAPLWCFSCYLCV